MSNAPPRVRPVSDATFDAEVMREALPMLIALYDDRGVSHREMMSTLSQIAGEYAGRLKVASIDVAANAMCAQLFRASTRPMFVALQSGKVRGHLKGRATKSALSALVKPLLPPDAILIDPEALARGLVQRKLVAIDVRGRARFQIPGAERVSLETLSLAQLARGDARVPVLYDRAGEEAISAARAFRDQGALLKALEGGFLAWEAAGLEVAAVTYE